MARIKWNRKAFEELRRMAAIEAALREEVEKALDKVGREHYAGGVERGKSRSRGYVVTTDAEGIEQESEEQSLLRALTGGSDD